MQSCIPPLGPAGDVGAGVVTRRPFDDAPPPRRGAPSAPPAQYFTPPPAAVTRGLTPGPSTSRTGPAGQSAPGPSTWQCFASGG